MNKKVGIIIVIVVVVLLIIGVVSKRDRIEYSAETDDITKLRISDNVNKVVVTESKDDKIHVTYSQGVGMDYNIGVKDGVLSIVCNNKKINITVGLDIYDNTLKVEVPKDFNKELEIKSEEKCTIDDHIQFSSKNIQCGSED